MKRATILLLLASLGLPARAEDVFTKDGKFARAQSIRREGNFLFLKIANAEGSSTETLLQISAVDRIVFPEPPNLLEARQLALGGNAEAVLSKTEALLPVIRPFADIPGNFWLELMRLRVASLAATQQSEGILGLQSTWIPTGDPDLESSLKLLSVHLAGRDKASFEATWRAHAVPGASTLSAAISWLALGNVALENHQWQEALRAFLSVEVFCINHRLLQPKALLGAIRAYIGRGDIKEARALQLELSNEYPGTPELKKANELLPSSGTPSLQNN